jgi:cardiolipin synthase (CMP-forming)
VTERARKPFLTANQVTFARLLSMPVLVWLFYQGRAGQWWALALGAAIATTDYLDGYLARKHGPTVLGGLMDPIADKIFVAVIFLAPLHLGWFPAWPVALIFVREFLITSLRTAYELRGIQLRTSYLAKVKTWMQMQGVATMIFYVLVDDHKVAWVFLLTGTALPLLVLLTAAVVQRRFRRGAAIMFGCFVLMDVLYLPEDVAATNWLMCLGLAIASWASGIDYLVGGMRQLRGQGGLRRGDLARLFGATALPCLVVACLVADAGAMWVAVSILAVELAVGGLDNLLAHHRQAASPVAWSARILTTSALLAAALAAAPLAGDQWAGSLTIAALTVSVGGGVREFVRGRAFYLDPHFRDQAAAG